MGLLMVLIYMAYDIFCINEAPFIPPQHIPIFNSMTRCGQSCLFSSVRAAVPVLIEKNSPAAETV